MGEQWPSKRRSERSRSEQSSHHIGLTDGITLALGHVSMRVPGEPDRFIVKGRGYAVDVLPVVRGEDMIVCDLDGAMVEGRQGACRASR